MAAIPDGGRCVRFVLDDGFGDTISKSNSMSLMSLKVDISNMFSVVFYLPSGLEGAYRIAT